MPDSFMPDAQDSFVADSFVPDQPTNQLKKPPQTWANGLGITNPILRGAVDLAEGVAAGGNNTLFQAGDILRRTVGAPRIINNPDVQQAMTPPPSLMGSIGKGAEQVGEFLVPAGLAGKGTKAVELATQGMKYAPALKALGRAGLEGLSAATVEGVHSGGNPDAIGEAGTMGATMPYATEAAATIGKPVIKGVTDLLGKMTGAGGEAIRTAATASSKKFMDAMRNRTSEMEIVQDLKNAVKQLTTDRANSYRQSFGQLDQTIQGDMKTIEQSLFDQLNAYKVGSGTGWQRLVGKGIFSTSPVVSKADQGLIRQAANDIGAWKDLSPAGLDTLKQRIYAYADSADPKVAPFFYRIGDTIKQQLNSRVPGYQDLTADYSTASELLQMVHKELSDQNVNPGIVIRKLAYALNQNNDYRRILLESLDKAAGSNLKDTLAGYHLKSFMPRGLAGVGSGMLATTAGAWMHNPAIIGSAIFSSPRVVGESMALLSNLIRAGQKIPTGMGTMGATGAAINVKEKLSPYLPPPPK